MTKKGKLIINKYSNYYKIAQEVKKQNKFTIAMDFLKHIKNKNFVGYEKLENEINLFYIAYARAKVKVTNNSYVEIDENTINAFVEDHLINL